MAAAVSFAPADCVADAKAALAKKVASMRPGEKFVDAQLALEGKLVRLSDAADQCQQSLDQSPRAVAQGSAYLFAFFVQNLFASELGDCATLSALASLAAMQKPGYQLAIFDERVRTHGIFAAVFYNINTDAWGWHLFDGLLLHRLSCLRSVSAQILSLQLTRSTESLHTLAALEMAQSSSGRCWAKRCVIVRSFGPVFARLFCVW